jgi:UDP-N-acetylmuramoyl-tripeptide--D-alanyl-D-alanine ligase
MQKVNTEQLFQLFLKNPSITTDTRKINPGEIFFALKGANFNGNQYALSALEAGAAYSVVDDPALPLNERLLWVEDVLLALQQLAAHYRNKLNIPVIAITGSNGKTTTKELVHSVLSKKYKTATTVGNLNNHIGIPLTLLRIPANSEIAVIEMGANHKLEIESYCQYVKPTHGLITNCGKAHLEGFGGVLGVRKGKGELFDYLKANNGLVFACSDFSYFHEMVAERKMSQIFWYGTNEEAALCGTLKNTSPFLSLEIKNGLEDKVDINTSLVGDYNIYNVLAAVSIGIFFEVHPSEISEAIANYQPDNSRSQLVEKDGNTIVLDAYNANPTSMAAAIKNFANLPATNKVLMIGAMAELGEESLEEHIAIVKLIDSFTWQKVVLVGGDFKNVKHNYTYFQDVHEAAAWWHANKSTGLTILLKGSRSTAMEKLLNF